MNRYIDKETMRGIIREQEKSHGIRGLAWIEMAMDKQEDADVQEVKHARWLPFYEDYRHQIVGDKCSLCGYSFFGGTYEHNYCPRCGAKMDEEEQK